MRASVILVLLVAGCNLAPRGPSAAVHGTPIEPGPNPNAAECAALIRLDLVTAKRIRAGMGIEGVPSDDAAVQAAASDSNADLEAFGIPLRADEMKAISASGAGVDEHSALSILVEVGAPERFGGQWIDPPGTDRYVVAVVGADPATLARARCVEGGDTRYVAAQRSLADGRAVQDRITADWQKLAAEGIRLVSVAYDVTTGKVVRGVTGATETVRARLVSLYGDVDVQESGPVIPL